MRESIERVLSAMNNSGFRVPLGRTTINLAPADLRKEGPSFDLPIALGVVQAAEQMSSASLPEFLIVGELALSGAVRPVKGVLAIALRARAEGRSGVLFDPLEEASMTGAVRRLLEEPGLSARLAAEGKREALARFHPERIARGHVEIYAEVLRSRA